MDSYLLKYLTVGVHVLLRTPQPSTSEPRGDSRCVTQNTLFGQGGKHGPNYRPINTLQPSPAKDGVCYLGT